VTPRPAAGARSAERLSRVFVSITTLDDELKRRMELRALAGGASRHGALPGRAGVPTE
jgi:hypothetical protein